MHDEKKLSLTAEGHPNLSKQIPPALNRYSVAPISIKEPPEPKLSDLPKRWSSPGVGGWYFALWLVVVNPVAVQIAMAPGHDTVLLFLPFVMIGVVVGIYHLHGRIRGQADRVAELAQRRNARELEIKKLLADAEREAASTADSLRQLLLQAGDFLSRSGQAVYAASAWLDRSTTDYEERAFAPFWDSIEAAAGHLATYQAMVRSLAAAAQRYSRTLSGRRHNFPVFPYSTADLPPATDIVSRLQAIVRGAQRDYEFATIWEQRKTRESVETGFGSLAAAVRDVGNAVSATVQEAHSAIEGSLREARSELAQHSSAIVDAVAAAGTAGAEAADRQREELKAILERQDRTLDDIRWRRKPLGAG